MNIKDTTSSVNVSSSRKGSSMEAILERDRLEAEIAALQQQIQWSTRTSDYDYQNDNNNNNNNDLDACSRTSSSDLCSLSSMSTNAKRKVVRRVVRRSVRHPPHHHQPDHNNEPSHHSQQQQQQQPHSHASTLGFGGSNHSSRSLSLNNASTHSTIRGGGGGGGTTTAPSLDLTPVDQTPQAKLDAQRAEEHRLQLEREIAAMEEAIATQRQKQLQKIIRSSRHLVETSTEKDGHGGGHPATPTTATTSTSSTPTTAAATKLLPSSNLSTASTGTTQSSESSPSSSTGSATMQPTPPPATHLRRASTGTCDSMALNKPELQAEIVAMEAVIQQQQEEEARQTALKAAFRSQQKQALLQAVKQQQEVKEQAQEEEEYEEEEYEEEEEYDEEEYDEELVDEANDNTSLHQQQQPSRPNFLNSIAQAAASRDERVESGETVQRDHAPEVESTNAKSNPFDLAGLVSQAARDREQRLQDTDGAKIMRPTKEVIQEEYKTICVEAAQLGRLTRLKEHVVEATAVDKTPEQAWKSQGLMAIQWRSNHMSVIHEAARTGAASKLPEKVTSNCPEYEQDGVDLEVEKLQFYDENNNNYNENGGHHGSKKFMSPRMKQLLELNQRVGHGQQKVDKLVLGRKEERGIVDNLLVRPMWCYSNVDDVQLPRAAPPKINVEARRRELAKRPMVDIGNEAATKAWERRARLDRPHQTPRVKEVCPCAYCKTASPYQTYAYKLKELRRKQKNGQGTVEDQVAIQFYQDEQRRERERRKAERMRRQALGIEDDSCMAGEDDVSLSTCQYDDMSYSFNDENINHNNAAMDDSSDSQSVYTTQTTASGNRRLVRKVRRVRRVPKKDPSQSSLDPSQQDASHLDPVVELTAEANTSTTTTPEEHKSLAAEPAEVTAVEQTEKAPAHHPLSSAHPPPTGQCCACAIL